MKIIDARVRLRTSQLMKAWTSNLKPYFKNYIKLYKMQERISIMDNQILIDHAASSGIKKMVVCGGNQEDNKHIINISKEFNQIIPVAGININDGILSAMKEVDRNIDNVAAFNISPFMSKLNNDDKLLYPIYGLCELYHKPIIIHGSLHYWNETSLNHSNPLLIDNIAVDFPNLKIIMSHGGNGFGDLALIVAQRHHNVFLEFSALYPRHMDQRFIKAANTYLKNKCIFGTDYPLCEFDDYIQLWKNTINEENWDLFFYQNIERVLLK